MTIKKTFFIYFISFFLLIIISSLLSPLSMDGVWCHGFSYNIASNLVPYRDFNMVIGPFYNIIISFFIRLFGNYILVFNIANSLIFGIVITWAYYKLKKDYLYLFLVLGLSPTIFGYNTFCAFLVIAILLLIDSKFKYKDWFIGILIGIIIMTKHNIGLFLALVYIFCNRKNLKVIFSIFIPIIPIVLYLVINDAFFSYLDLCYFGLGNFMDNFHTDIFSFTVLLIVLILLIRSFTKTKDIKVLYVLAFQIVSFPIMDQGHIIPGLIPAVYYFLLQNNKLVNFYLKIFLCVGFVTIIVIVSSFNNRVNFDGGFLNFQKVSNNLNTYLKGYSTYIDNNKDKKVYLFLDNAYLIKIYRNENPTFFDLINDGNMGGNELDYIERLDSECKNSECVFILDMTYFKKKLTYTQISFMYKDYVLDNASYLETLPSGDRVYINY